MPSELARGKGFIALGTLTKQYGKDDDFQREGDARQKSSPDCWAEWEGSSEHQVQKEVPAISVKSSTEHP